METAELVFKIIFVVAVFAISLVIAMYSTYAERKVAAFFRIVLDPIVPVHSGCCNHLPTVLRCL